LPRYYCPGRYQGKGGWGWWPALVGVKGIGAIGAGPRSRGDHHTLHVHCVFFGKLLKEASIEAVANASLNPGLDGALLRELAEEYAVDMECMVVPPGEWPSPYGPLPPNPFA